MNPGTGFFQVIELSQLVNLVVGFVAALAAWGILHFLDWLAKADFSAHMETMESDPKALAFYLGARFAAVLYFVAALLK